MGNRFERLAWASNRNVRVMFATVLGISFSTGCDIPSARLGAAAADAFTIMKLMEHSAVTVSQRYVHPSPEAVELAFGRLPALNLHGLAQNRARSIRLY